jgi:hypothetical protein
VPKHSKPGVVLLGTFNVIISNGAHRLIEDANRAAKDLLDQNVVTLMPQPFAAPT